MDRPGKMFWSFQFALDKRLVDDNLGRDVSQFTSLPGFHLLSHRLKASLHSVDSNRNAINERKRLRVVHLRIFPICLPSLDELVGGAELCPYPVAARTTVASRTSSKTLPRSSPCAMSDLLAAFRA